MFGVKLVFIMSSPLNSKDRMLADWVLGGPGQSCLTPADLVGCCEGGWGHMAAVWGPSVMNKGRDLANLYASSHCQTACPRMNSVSMINLNEPMKPCVQPRGR